MEVFSALDGVIFALLIGPAFLPLIIRKPAGPNRFGPRPESQSFGGAIKVCLIKYVNGRGRATRSEYWWFYLFAVLVSIGAGIIAGLTGVAALFYISYALWLPLFVAGRRRLQDINRSGWWLLISFGLGAIVLLYWMVQPSQVDEEQVAQVFE